MCIYAHEQQRRAATAQPHSPHHVPRRLEGRENTCRKSAGARAARCSLSAWLRLDENDLVAAEEELSGIIHLFLPPQPPRQSRWIGIPLFPLATLASREHFFIRSTDRTKIQGQLPCPKNVHLSEESIRPSPTASSAQHPTTTHPQKTTSKMSSRLTCSRESSL